MKFGQFVRGLAIASLLGFVWGVFVAATLLALSELGVLDSNHTLARVYAVAWLYLALFSVIAAATQVGFRISSKLQSASDFKEAEICSPRDRRAAASLRRRA